MIRDNCNCNKPVHKQFKDISKIENQPWEDAESIVALDKCGNTIVVDKPEFELTEEDVQKLDSIIIDGDGTKFLSDDGTYKEIEADTKVVILTYDANPTNFILLNQDKLVEIKEALDDEAGVQVRLVYNQYELPVQVGRRVTDQLILEYDAVNYPIAGGGLYQRLKINIVLNTTSDPYTLVNYEVNNPSDADYVIDVTGDGASALYNDGTYKPTYTKPQVDELLAPINGEITQLQNDLASEILTRESVDTNLQNQILDANTYAQATREALENGLADISDELGTINTNITNLTSQVNINTSDIEGLQAAIADSDHFRGYYQTTDEITSLPNPTTGDFAWNAATGTVWIYNGTTWADSTDPIPSDAPTASDDTPLMDGAASSGTSSLYSRGDHRHPSDVNKADVTALANYLPLAGNTQTNQMTGAIWLGQENRLYLSNSGNSYLGFDDISSALQLRGNGVGGIDLLSDNGTIKANGQRIIVNGQNVSPVQISSEVINLNGGGSSGAAISLASAQMALSGNILSGTFTGNINFVTSDGNIYLQPTTGKVYYGAAIDSNEIARISNIIDYSGDISALSSQVSDLSGQVQSFDGRIQTLESSVSTIQSSYVTINTSQSITGRKSFTGGINVSGIEINGTDKTAEINTIVIDGDGESYLANDGTYKPVQSGSNTSVGRVTVNTISAEIPSGITSDTLIYVAYNRQMLLESDYTLSGTTVTLINIDITSQFTSSDTLDIKYLINS